MSCVGILEAEEGKLSQVICRFLSRNMIKGTWQATDEERLIEIVVELKDHLSVDLQTSQTDPDEDNLEVLYPTFSRELQVKAKLFLGEGGYRRLCCISSFFLGLVMLSRVRRHYIHAPWFKVTTLDEMVKFHGGVSVFIQYKKIGLWIYSSSRTL
jgi:hypothetical protein